MRTKCNLLICLLLFLGIFVFTNYSSASTIDILQPASPAGGPAQAITYNEDLTVNGTGRFDSIYIGKQGVGGVTFFNGTIINDTTNEDGVPNSVTFGDNVRIDGYLHGGPSLGYEDERAIKIGDHIYPGLDNANDFGKATHRFKDAYFAGNVTVGNLLGSGIVDYRNLDTSNTGSANQLLSYNGSELEWVTIGTSSSDDDTDDGSTVTVGDITGVTTATGSGLTGGGTSGTVSLSVSGVTSSMITDGTIVGADINSSTNISVNNLIVNGNTTLGTSGESFTYMKHGIISIDPPSIGANTSTSFNTTLSGLATGDLIFLTPNINIPDTFYYQGAYVSAANTLTIKIRNTSGLSFNDGAENWDYLIIRP
jgi:hypothetical protein